MMKKLTALLLSLLMLCTLATAQTADYTGTWYLVSLEASGIAINPADLGMEMIVTLNADGTGLISTTGEEDEAATWTLDDGTLTITADDSPLDFELNADGQLVGEAEENIMFFGREPAGPGFVPAAEIAAEDIAAFDGNWTITTVDAYGMIVPFSVMAQMGLEGESVVIQNGSIQSFCIEETELGTFADGKLVVAAPAETDEALGKTISLLEDGTLSMAYMEMIFYCEKVEIAQ